MKPLHERRAPFKETEREILRFLKEHGPAQRWQVKAALGRCCASSIAALIKQGYAAEVLDVNTDPRPGVIKERELANYLVFVRGMGPRKGASDSSLRWAVKVLRAAGYTVIPPGDA